MIRRRKVDGTKYAAASSRAAIEGVDALIWQLAASVALPGYTIHQLVAIVVALLDASGVDQTGVISALPTACGLAMIPFIVKPLDELAEVAMDVTFRKVSAPYLSRAGEGRRERKSGTARHHSGHGDGEDPLDGVVADGEVTREPSSSCPRSLLRRHGARYQTTSHSFPVLTSSPGRRG